jgi:hypothetical protein
MSNSLPGSLASPFSNPLPMAPAPTGAVTKLCPHCLTENDASAHMCRRCLTPMTFFAATVPVFSIWAECDTYYKASRSPTKFIVVLGMWLVCGVNGMVWLAGAIAVAAGAMHPIYGRYFSGQEDGVLAMVPLAALGCIFGWLAILSTSAYFRHRGRAAVGKPPVVEEDEELTRAALEAAPEGTEPGDVEGDGKDDLLSG